MARFLVYVFGIPKLRSVSAKNICKASEIVKSWGVHEGYLIMHEGEELECG